MLKTGLSDEKKEEVYPEYAKIASICLTGDPNVDPGGLDNGLYRFLERANKMMFTAAGGTLDSRQVIVTLILIYKAEHPNTELYSKHFL